jgi:hypothetical protein
MFQGVLLAEAAGLVSPAYVVSWIPLTEAGVDASARGAQCNPARSSRMVMDVEALIEKGAENICV